MTIGDGTSGSCHLGCPGGREGRSHFVGSILTNVNTGVCRHECAVLTAVADAHES